VPPREHRHIKYRAELLSCRSRVKVTVLEQTHRDRDFALPEDGIDRYSDGVSFVHENFILGSWSYPEFLSGSDWVAVRGGYKGEDHKPITFPTLQSYNDFKAAVLAYNERYK